MGPCTHVVLTIFGGIVMSDNCYGNIVDERLSEYDLSAEPSTETAVAGKSKPSQTL